MQIIITQNPEAEPSDEVLPVSYPKFTSMIQKGDLIFIGRYLVTGSEDSSLYVKVSSSLMLRWRVCASGLCSLGMQLCCSS